MTVKIIFFIVLLLFVDVFWKTSFVHGKHSNADNVKTKKSQIPPSRELKDDIDDSNHDRIAKTIEHLRELEEIGESLLKRVSAENDSTKKKVTKPKDESIITNKHENLNEVTRQESKQKTVNDAMVDKKTWLEVAAVINDIDLDSVIGSSSLLTSRIESQEKEDSDENEDIKNKYSLREDSGSTLESLTPKEQEGEELFIQAQAVLNSTRSNKSDAYKLLTKAALIGHKESRSMLAWAKLLGTQTGLPTAETQDISETLPIFMELANYGIPSAHMAMGFFYSMGLNGVVASQSKAFLHYTIAAFGGDTMAQMVIGYRYWAGVSTATNCEKALDFYRKVGNKVAEQVSLSGGPVIQRIRLLDEQENPEYNSGILDDDLIEYYQLLAERGDVQAQVGLGQLHYQGGRGVPLDHQRALEYFQNAADAGNPIAMAFLGKIYLEGSDIVRQDNETAYHYFAKAAMLGNPVGQSGLGLMYLYGKGVERDTTKALQYFSQAAEQGWVDGQLQLGNMYFSGIGVKRDYGRANNYFRLASQSGHVLAFYNMAQMHATGTGMMRSCSTAVQLLKNVAERGKWSNQLMIAHADYKSGRINHAFLRYALLGEMGYEVAQSNAAFILDHDEASVLNREKGLVMALSFWARSAAQDYSPAQVKLGDAHYYGRGTVVDYEAAAAYYRSASDHQHNAQAMFNLGYMYEQGLGLNRDRHLAKRCYDSAAEANPDARIPVGLALIKLLLLFSIDYVQEFNYWEQFGEWNHLIGHNWDLYLIGFFTGMLSLIIYFRRPQPQQLNLLDAIRH